MNQRKLPPRTKIGLTIKPQIIVEMHAIEILSIKILVEAQREHKKIITLSNNNKAQHEINKE